MAEHKDEGGIFQQHSGKDAVEDWADMFLYWVYKGFDNTSSGINRNEFMDDTMKVVMNVAYGRGLGESLFARLYFKIDQYGTGSVKSDLTDTVNLRKSPYKEDGNIVDGLIPGEKFSVIGKSKASPGWVLVMTQSGLFGWMHIQNLDIENREGIRELTSDDPLSIGY